MSDTEDRERMLLAVIEEMDAALQTLAWRDNCWCPMLLNIGGKLHHTAQCAHARIARAAGLAARGKGNNPDEMDSSHEEIPAENESEESPQITVEAGVPKQQPARPLLPGFVDRVCGWLWPSSPQ